MNHAASGSTSSVPLPGKDIDQLAINTIRALAMDAVQKAKSGHPGTPMGVAPVGYTLWQQMLRYDPADQHWPNRDRFVLSVGHASMLLYSLLHLAQVERDDDNEGEGPFAVRLADIEQFRQLSSVTPGHPEYRMETTTGPLAQGVSNSVGMAMAQRFLAQRYNKPGFALFDYHVYALCGDGCMMEGVSNEAASVAGHLKLSNLTWIYDSNRITIEGSTDLTFNEDVSKSLEALGWDVRDVTDANDTAAIARALDEAKAVTGRHGIAPCIGSRVQSRILVRLASPLNCSLHTKRQTCRRGSLRASRPITHSIRPRTSSNRNEGMH